MPNISKLLPYQDSSLDNGDVFGTRVVGDVRRGQRYRQEENESNPVSEILTKFFVCKDENPTPGNI